MAPPAASWPHYAWAFGHFVVLLSSLRYFVAYVTLKSASYGFYYNVAYLGTLMSYAIVCYKSLGTPQPSRAFVQRALADENVQYLLLALYWRSSKAVPISLVPYAIFSLFHVLTFTRANILPMMSHQPAPATAGAQAPPPTPSPLAKKIHSWVKGNYDSAMVLVAQIEIVILIRVTLGVLAFQNSLFTPIFYAHFLRVRYYHSNFSRDTIGAASRFIDNLVAGPSFPPVARTAWGSAKSVISRWGSSSVITPAQPNGAAQPQAANANAAGAR